jgi:polyphosphate kinase
MAAIRALEQIRRSRYISRDMSWLRFNYRVLDQARDPQKTLFDRLRFLAITCSNLDEFFMIRVGSLYNYLDYSKERIDYSGLRELPFRKRLLDMAHRFVGEQASAYQRELQPHFAENGFQILTPEELTEGEQRKADQYFRNTIFPLLTPMVYDSYHGFPLLMNGLLTFGVITRVAEAGDDSAQTRLTFVQVPQNLARFLEISRKEQLVFVPIESIIRDNLDRLFRNVEILSSSVFRVTRNGDFTLEESDDIDVDFVKEIKAGIKTRKRGRVVRIEVERGAAAELLKTLKERLRVDNANIFHIPHLIDLRGLTQIVRHPQFKGRGFRSPAPVAPRSLPALEVDNLFGYLKHHDVLLHHPYNSIEPVVGLLEKASIDPHVLGIKMTIYRLSDDSRITAALLRAAENGKHVSVLFEVKARFDEERNLREGEKLEKAGCFVIYGISKYKTHTKMLMVIRKEGEKVTRYVHLGSGNYNETTSRFYSDVSLLTTDEVYAHDVSEFFNVITGHSQPDDYRHLITAPRDMRQQLIGLIRDEARAAKKGLPAGIVMKMNSLEDREIIDELYKAGRAGVPIQLIVRGICCLRPGRAVLSERIQVRSLVGEYLEHSRLYYFHHAGQPRVYGGSADMMVRSFDRRIEALFLIANPELRQETIAILMLNLLDNQNAYLMREDGNYVRRQPQEGEAIVNVHRDFYRSHEAAPLLEATPASLLALLHELHHPVRPNANDVDTDFEDLEGDSEDGDESPADAPFIAAPPVPSTEPLSEPHSEEAALAD